jgi:ABC-type transport system involved in multi-copper enzyme maturation permease subunit
MAIGVMARLTFHEAARRKILWAALGLGLAFLALYGVGLYFINRDAAPNMGRDSRSFKEAMNFITMAGLYVVNFLVVMMTVLTSVDTLSGEIASGTIQTIVSKPVPRWQIVLGKWFGFALMLLLYIALMAGGVVLVTYVIAGVTPPNVLTGLALLALEALVLLSLTLLGGTLFSTLANGVLAFGLYGIAFIGGWVEQIGSFLHNDTAVNIGIISSLLMPSEALWKRAAYEMQTYAMREFGLTPFSAASVPSPAMMVYAVLYAAALLGLAMWVFSRRDL